MSQTLIFQIGSVISIAVGAAVFAYGYLWFGALEDDDDAPAAEQASVVN